MIYVCLICGKESGVTHGDQLWVSEVCEECQALQDNAEQLEIDKAIDNDMEHARHGV